MSLFGSLQLANNSLKASQIGLQVAGNNIANANTPGYIREEVVLTPAPTQRVGDLVLGLGVDVQAVVQKVDRFLEERLRDASSDLASGEAQENAYLQLESLVGELSDTDLSTSLSSFFGSIQDILNQPESESVRNLAVLQGATLADDIGRLDQRAREVHEDINNQIVAAADDINSLLGEVAELNRKIVETEGGEVSDSEAVGLRDKRMVALSKLSEMMNIQTAEQPDGSVTVLSAGEYLVSSATYRDVKVHRQAEGNLSKAELRFAKTDYPVQISSGKVAGLMESRDRILGGFLGSLNDFSRTLAYEFNKVYTSGQGLSGHTTLRSENTVEDPDAALDAAGLPYTPSTGSFEVQVYNRQTGLTQTSEISIDLDGLDSDTTLTSLQASLDAIDGLSAEISPQRGLELQAEGDHLEFAFANDNSGALASLGLGVFFTGGGAHELDVSKAVREDPSKFAASAGGIGADTDIAVKLAAFQDEPLEGRDGASLSVLYEQMTNEVTQGAAVSRSVADGFRVFHNTLEGQKLATSGVSLDEEAMDMMTYQRTYQATARYIQTLSELLDVLVNL